MRVSLGLAILLLAACAGPEAARPHLENGDRYLAQDKPREAIIEYRNALEYDDKLGEARYGLARALAQTGNTEGAFREYIRAADLLPDNDQVQVAAATVLLMAGQFEDVRTRVERLLQRRPDHVEGQILLASAMAGLRDLEGAVTQIEEAIKLDPDNAPAQTSLGLLRVAQGDRDAARAAFEKAVQLDPESIRAWLSLANFQWSIGALPQAEESLGRALALDPNHLLANRAIAALYMVTRRAARAEPHVQAYARNDPGPGGRFALADYYAQQGRLDDAEAVLAPMAGDQRTFADARTRLAGLAYLRGERTQAHAALDEVFERLPSHTPALVTKARWLVAEGQLKAALERATAAVSAAPRDLAARYLLGTIQTANGEYDQAVTSFNEVLRWNPRAAAAQVQLSHLGLLRRDPASAVQMAEAAVKNAPRSPEARLTLARSLLASRDLVRAEQEIRRLLGDFPQASAVHAAHGTLRILKQDDAAARGAYQEAYRLDDSSIAALTGLTVLDLREKKPAAARARLEARLAASPNRPDLLVLLGKVYVAQNDLANAERVLRQAIQLDPVTFDAYGILVEIYRQQQRVDAARAEFDAIASRDARDVAARTMSALLLHAQSKLPEAKQRYIEVLALNPRVAVAANNLAWIYADEGENLDTALQLAERAAEQVPDRPEMRNTVGWVYYRKQLPQLAIGPFEQAVAQQPDNATFHYYLGLAYVKSGNRVRGREAFERALKLNPDYRDAERELGDLQ